MLSRKLVEVLGWLNQADELIQRCQDDLTRSRTYEHPKVKERAENALADLKGQLASIRFHLDSAACAFIYLEKNTGSTKFTCHQEKAC